MRFTNVELSKVMSHALRHEPWLYEIEIDEDGWTSLDTLISSLKKLGLDWETLSCSDIEKMIASSDKVRHELLGNQIRALYGHSVPGKLRKALAEPPNVLFHGTSLAAAESILRNGLKPMSRQYVHLSIDEETAKQVGGRKSSSSVILKVNAGVAFANGVTFYAGNEKVWLADFVAPHYLAKHIL